MNPSAGTPTLNGAATGQTPNSNLGTGSTAARIRITYATPQSVTPGTTDVSFNITGVTNSSSAGTFYARIGFFSDNAWTTYTDGGGMAQSVQAVQTVSFKVQETLSFCVGSMDNTTVSFGGFSAASLGNGCSDSSGTSISTGIAPDSTTACVTPAETRSATCDDTDGAVADDHYGYAMIATNASNGATVGYRPDDNGTTFTEGTMQIASASCSGFTSSERADGCINPVNEDQSVAVGTAAAFVTTSANELFGMAVPAVNATGRATSALARNTTSTGYGYTGNITGSACSAGTSTTDCWNWHRTGTATLASASSPLDNEALQIFFATKAGITTPSGAYAVNIDYYSVPTY